MIIQKLHLNIKGCLHAKLGLIYLEEKMIHSSFITYELFKLHSYRKKLLSRIKKEKQFTNQSIRLRILDNKYEEKCNEVEYMIANENRAEYKQLYINQLNEYKEKYKRKRDSLVNKITKYRISILNDLKAKEAKYLNRLNLIEEKLTIYYSSACVINKFFPEVKFIDHKAMLEDFRDIYHKYQI